jgi:predicted phage terminase large subunit-like protein
MEKRSKAKLARRQRLNPYGFSALYQGRPTPRTGSTYDVTKIRIVEKPRARIVREVRYWDKAGTQDGGKRTAGVKMAILSDKSFLFLHVVKGQWAAGPREKNIKDTAETDGKKVTIIVEQEPGSGGKESAEATVRNLIGYTVKIDKVTGSKELRADPLATQIDGNNVEMIRGDWNQGLKDELRAFPRGAFKDQADASAGAFNELAAGAGIASFDDLIKD